MRPTHVFDRVISNMSQDAATLWMKEPTAERTFAIQSVRNEPYRSGATAEVIG
jgi:hypothetical protein